MKKIVFTLMMLFAILFVAKDVMAQGKFAPLPGGTYSYTLDIALDGISDATLTATGLTTGTSVISNISPALANIPANTTEITFDITYSDNATGTCTLDFAITDQTSLTCGNSIFKLIPMSALPTYTLAIVADETGYSSCQARTGPGDNTADALGDGSEANSFTFTVEPIVQNVPATYTYTYTISLPAGTGLLAFDDGSSAVTGYNLGVVTRTETDASDSHVFTVTFNTTTGESAQDLIATLTAGISSQLTLGAADGGGVYNATTATGGSLSQTVSVGAVPTIGSFN